MTKTSLAKTKLQGTHPHLPSRPLRLWQHSNSQESETRIEMLPLIDVIFCILVFFLLGAVGLSRQQAISLDLPKASTGTPQMREMLVVSLDDLGQLYVEKNIVTKNQLYNAIKNYHQNNRQGLMVLHAARNASYNEVVQVLDIMRQVGGDRVALATLPGQPGTINQFSPDSLTPVPSGTNLPPTTPNLPSRSQQGTNPSGTPRFPGLPNTQ